MADIGIYTVDTAIAERDQGVQNREPVFVADTSKSAQGVVHTFHPDRTRVDIVSGYGGAFPMITMERRFNASPSDIPLLRVLKESERSGPRPWQARPVTRYEDHDDIE